MTSKTDTPFHLEEATIGQMHAAIKAGLATGGWSLRSGIGIVICQFLVSVSYCIRANGPYHARAKDARLWVIAYGRRTGESCRPMDTVSRGV